MARTTKTTTAPLDPAVMADEPVAETTTPAEPVAPAKPPVDLTKTLVDALAEKGVAVELRPSPKGNYSTIVADGVSIGYVHKQSARGLRVEIIPETLVDAAGVKRMATSLAAVAKRRSESAEG